MQLFDHSLHVQDEIFAADLVNSKQDNKVSVYEWNYKLHSKVKEAFGRLVVNDTNIKLVFA